MKLSMRLGALRADLWFMLASMNISGERQKSFVFEVPPSRTRRVIACICLGSYLLIFSYMPWKLGLGRFTAELLINPVAWFILAVLAGLAALFIRLTFPPRSTWAKLRIEPHRISYTAGQIERLFDGTVLELAIPTDACEIRFCRSYLDELVDGYRIVVRSKSGSEREIQPHILNLLDARECEQLAEGIEAVTGLPVGFFVRQRRAASPMIERPWVPADERPIGRGAAFMVAGALPIAGGVATGICATSIAQGFGAGIALWIIQRATVSALAPRGRKWATVLTLNSLTTAFTFGAAFAAAAVISAYFVHQR
jgi:hypothetical protein